MAGHHVVERDPWPVTTGWYDYLDFTGLDEQGRVRIQTTSGEIGALGFIGGIGAGTVDTRPVRLSAGTGPEPVHDKICVEITAITPDGAGGYSVAYHLAEHRPDGGCAPCPTPR